MAIFTFHMYLFLFTTFKGSAPLLTLTSQKVLERESQKLKCAHTCRGSQRSKKSSLVHASYWRSSESWAPIPHLYFWKKSPYMPNCEILTWDLGPISLWQRKWLSTFLKRVTAESLYVPNSLQKQRCCVRSASFPPTSHPKRSHGKKVLARPARIIGGGGFQMSLRLLSFVMLRKQDAGFRLPLACAIDFVEISQATGRASKMSGSLII